MKSFNLFLTVALVLALTCLHAQEIEGGPVHSSKLDKENGFKKLVIGKTLKEVKSILMKTPLEPSQSRDPETYNAEYNTALYLVDLKKGYDKFLGVPVDRIEVLFAPNMWSEKENAPDAISEVVIYFK
ncbi:MAG TPA: hypothetical protein VD905_11845, partial [Flavobacteriales bacterium]|nr:hypothetical protein [Flavobacteriales bacterium]